jgi:acetyltransferase-like isoleucine patch superfamily enzyme
MSLRSLAAFLYRYSSVTKIIVGMRFPGIRIAGGGRLDIRGRFQYGAGCTIGVGSNLIVRSGKTLRLGSKCSIGRFVEFGPDPQIRIGNESSIQDRSILLGNVTLGRYCSLAPNVYISSGRHCFDLLPHELIKDQDRLVSQNKMMSIAAGKPVVVEDDCWLGINVVVMPGVTIGKGAVVGANSVVTKDVGPYTIVAGVPARMLKKRLDFLPPRQIIFDNAGDRPYFYAGFEVAQKRIAEAERAGGIEAACEFVIALDRSSGRSLHLIARAEHEGNTTLEFEDQRVNITAEYTEAVFTINEAGGNRMHFSARTSGGPANVLVKKVWIQ